MMPGVMNKKSIYRELENVVPLPLNARSPTFYKHGQQRIHATKLKPVETKSVIASTPNFIHSQVSYFLDDKTKLV